MVLTNNDRDLLTRCLAREPYSWNQFVDRFLGLVLHIIRHTAHSHGVQLHDADCEDLTADVFLAFVDRDFAVLRRFRGRSSLATYLTVVARRVVLQRMLQDRTNSGRTMADFGDDLPDAPSGQHLGDREEVERLLAELEPPEAEVVRMYHLEGKSYREISSHIGVPENSIGPTLSRARSKMRRVREDSRVS